jgi:hypothetical protein
MSDLLLSEKLIQDAASGSDRLARIVIDILDWGWDPPGKDDVVTQEYSFQDGRIDILATFGDRTKVLLVEVKQGAAGAVAVQQLAHYMAKFDVAKAVGGPPEDVRGIVIAQSFHASAADAASNHPKIGLVEFHLERNRFPFRRPTPPKVTQTEQKEPPTSGLTTVYTHAKRIADPDLRQAFQDLSEGVRSGASIEAERRHWLYANAKNEHVWVRYKGERVLCLWARKDHFEVGYFHGEPWGVDTVFPADARTLLPEIEAAVSKTLDRIDARTVDLNLFRWSDLQG